jgi:hypothetical protein
MIMKRLKTQPRVCWSLLAALPLSVASTTQADMISNVAVGLGAAGFDIRGDRNILSDGFDILVTNSFNGALFDFGVAELVLTGPLSMEVSTSNRLLPSLDIAFTTAIDGRRDASPLRYDFVFDVGGQQTNVTGSILMDANLSINQFGWYDLGVTYSSRQTVDNDGRFSNATIENDFDIGPINVRGNIFADMLAAVTDPFFEATNTPNLFASFSGRERLKQIMADQQSYLSSQAASALSEWSSNGTLFTDVIGLSNGSASSTPRGNSVFDVGVTDPTGFNASGLTHSHAAPNSFAGIVPEPTVLLLMLLGIPAILAHRRHRIRM